MNVLTHFPADIGVIIEAWRRQLCCAGTVQFKVNMTGSCTVRNHRHRQGSCVCWVIHNFHVEHGGHTTKALCTDTQLVDLLEQLQTQLFRTVLRATLLQFVNVDRVHQGFFGHHSRFLSRAANTDTQHTGRAPACSHGRHSLQNPIHNAVGRVEHGQLGFVFRTTALGCHLKVHSIARYKLHVDNRGSVVFGVLTLASRIIKNGGAQNIVRMGVGLTNTFINQVFQAFLSIKANIHAHFYENGHNSRVLTERSLTHRTHTGINKNLSHCVLGRWRLFPLPGFMDALDKIYRVVIRDELQSISNTLNYIFLLNCCHSSNPTIRHFFALFFGYLKETGTYSDSGGVRFLNSTSAPPLYPPLLAVSASGKWKISFVTIKSLCVPRGD